MQILIPDSWLREFVVTNAKPADVARCLSLCGPTVDRVKKVDGDYIYDIEITTNRVDAMSVYGIAREASAILPEFGFKARLKPYKTNPISHKKTLDIEIVNNPKLCNRILAVKLTNVKLGPSPKWLQERLEKVGQRSLNNAIDISNYVMWEIGHPTHVFDYDAIAKKKIVVRQAKKGEELISLDNVKHKLNGGEVVFDDGKGEIIDLPGIMGAKNTVVTNKTKNVLLWIESVTAEKIRQASMGLNIRSQAAILNEKHVDSELGLPAIEKGVELFVKLTNAKVDSQLIDIYPIKQRLKVVKLKKDFIDKRLGINISKSNIRKYLQALEFDVTWSGNTLKVKAPTFRSHDIGIPEDIVEEIARIYGYYQFPSNLMSSALPEKLADSPFTFEVVLKNIIKSLGGTEIYTQSLVPKQWVAKDALKLKNPLGPDTAYLRTTLRHSLVNAAFGNTGETESFHLFEIANIYLPRKDELPEEKMTLAGIFANSDYRSAKGVIESLLHQLNITHELIQSDGNNFKPTQRLEVKVDGKLMGEFGVLENNLIYYELDVNALQKAYRQYPTFKPIPKYPSQIEDVTLILPERTKVGEVISSIKLTDKLISNVELTDIFKDAHTFRIWYQDPKKTLTDTEVKKIREKLLKGVKKKFGASLKR